MTDNLRARPYFLNHPSLILLIFYPSWIKDSLSHHDCRWVNTMPTDDNIVIIQRKNTTTISQDSKRSLVDSESNIGLFRRLGSVRKLQFPKELGVKSTTKQFKLLLRGVVVWLRIRCVPSFDPALNNPYSTTYDKQLLIHRIDLLSLYRCLLSLSDISPETFVYLFFVVVLIFDSDSEWWSTRYNGTFIFSSPYRWYYAHAS